MKTQNAYSGAALLLAFMLASAGGVRAQNTIVAYDVPAGTIGNHWEAGLVVGNDFHVVSPIAIWYLGVFSSGTNNGIQGGTVLTVQLWERSGRHAGTLLESMTFDAASPGTLYGGSLFKTLATPLRLLPGNYTIAAYAFDAANPEGNAGLVPFNGTPPPWTMNNGGGLIQFEGVSRFGRNVAGQYPAHLDTGPVNRFAAGTFAYTAATLPNPPYATDYAALTAGVSSFPVEDTKHLGSIGVLNGGAFPVLVEQGGNRLVLEAAGAYNGNSSGARAVAFSHFQWEDARNDSRATLFENAIKWASRKSNPADIVVGVTTNLNLSFRTNLDLSYLASRGYQVISINCETIDLASGLPPMDVLVADGHARYLERAGDLIKRFTANGGGLVMSLAPRFVVYPNIRPAFVAANDILQPFGLGYRSSLAVPADFGFTNIQAIPYPIYFSAFPAAQLLYQDRVGQARLNGQEKGIALNTINYSVNGRPDLLPLLTALYSSGSTNNLNPPLPTGGVGNFVDAVVLTGAQASTNRLGTWAAIGDDLLALSGRGGVDYQFTLPAADVYRLQVVGTQGTTNSLCNGFNLLLSVDGQSLGHHTLTAAYGVGGLVECLTPYLSAGPHTLRVFWENHAAGTFLRLRSVHLQTGIGQDSNGDGLKDWVAQLVHAQSGFDLTNATISSFTSPICLEGLDPYPSMMQLNIESADSQIPQVYARPGPNGRWYANVPLSAYVNAQTLLQATYQNGSFTETKTLQWTPLNLLTDGDMTIRQGDALLLNARPPTGPNGNLLITVGTNQLTGRTSQPIVYRFADAGVYTVTGTYTTAQGAAQSRSITVTAVGPTFKNNPDCWVGMERQWDLQSVATQAVMEADSHLLFEQTGTLPGNGKRMSLLIDQNEARYILSRLGTNGPVLDSARAVGFDLWSPPDTYLRFVQTNLDGSQLVEMLLVFSPIPADAVIQLDTIVGGITFDDGTTTRTLTASDFGALGRCTVRFIRPATARTSTCHSIKVFQGADLVGYRR